MTQQLQVIEAPQHPPEVLWLQQHLKQNLRQIESVIPAGALAPERFARVFFTAMTQGPAYPGAARLSQCTSVSVIQCAMDLAYLGLVPNTPRQQAALIPYKEKNDTIVAKIQVMKRGWIDLALRSGTVLALKASAVFAHDHFLWSEGPDGQVEHRIDPRRDPGELIASYAWARLENGEVIRDILRLPQIERNRETALKKLREEWQKANSPWTTHFDRMAEKSVLKHFISNQIDLDDRMEKAMDVDTDHDARSVDATPSIPDLRGPAPVLPALGIEAAKAQARQKAPPAPAGVRSIAGSPPLVTPETERPVANDPRGPFVDVSRPPIDVTPELGPPPDGWEVALDSQKRPYHRRKDAPPATEKPRANPEERAGAQNELAAVKAEISRILGPEKAAEPLRAVESKRSLRDRLKVANEILHQALQSKPPAPPTPPTAAVEPQPEDEDDTESDLEEVLDAAR